MWQNIQKWNITLHKHTGLIIKEKTQQKEGHKILKEDAFRKAEGKRIAALIKAQEEEKNQRIQLMKLSIQSITNYLLMDILKILRRDLESTLHRYSRALA